MNKNKEEWNKYFDEPRKGNSSSNPLIRLNFSLKGDPAKWLVTWKNRGLIVSNHDCVIQAFQVLNQKIVECDLKAARLRTLREETNR